MAYIERRLFDGNDALQPKKKKVMSSLQAYAAFKIDDT